MAFTYTGFTASGQVAREWYSKFVLGSRSVNTLGQMLGVKENGMNLPILDITNPLTDASCTFDPDGDVTLTTRKMSCTKVDIAIEICTDDLEQSFLSELLAAGSEVTEGDIPSYITDMFLARAQARISEAVEKLIWQGDTTAGASSPLRFIDGLQKVLLADTNVVQVTGTTLTASNIATELDKVIAAIPDEMLDKIGDMGYPKVGIGMNEKSFRLYMQWRNANLFANTINIEQPQDVDYQGVKLFRFPGMSANRMVFADFSRIFFGTDLLSDMEDIRIINLRETTGDKNIRMLGSFRVGVQYAVSQEIVYYRS